MTMLSTQPDSCHVDQTFLVGLLHICSRELSNRLGIQTKNCNYTFPPKKNKLLLMITFSEL